MSYVRCSILGTTVGGEVWSVNPVFDPTGEFPGGVDQAALQSAATAIANIAVPTSLKTLLSTALSQSGCRLEVREDSNDALIALAETVFPGNQPGTGTPKMGAQSAVVVSVLTNTPGARGRGRIYWPAVGATIDVNLRLSSPTTTVVATDMATYLHAIETALATAFPTIGFDLAVRSKTAHATPHAVRLRVGNVIDSQRRRQDQFVESFATVAM